MNDDGQMVSMGTQQKDQELEDVLRILRDAPARASQIMVTVTDEHVRMIEHLEALPENQWGSDKSHVWPGMRAFVESFAHVRPMSRRP